MQMLAAIAATVVVVSCLPCLTTAAIVDAGTLTSVIVEAPLYDTNLSNENGCDPSGCVADLTRDGDLTSRWSCKPALGPSGSTCSISFSLGESLSLEGLNIALYEGDTRTRTIEIYVDGDLSKAWTSSGTTSSFETVSLGSRGQIIELRGDLENSEWLSILEVEILTDDGGDSIVVEAGTLGTVITTSALYDTRDFDSGGCDPSGCTASLTRDGDLAGASRWSCAPSLGGLCTLTYDLGAVRNLSELRLAMYKGDERTRSVEVYVDNDLATTWTSSGTMNGFESIDLSGISGEVIQVTGVLTNSEWLSITEVDIMVLSDGDTPTPTPSEDLTAVGSLQLASGDGSDLDRFYAKDGDSSTSWTCTGGPSDSDTFYHDCTIYFRLFTYRHIKQVKIALTDGDMRVMDMSISGSYSGDLFVETVTSSGSTDELETYNFDYFTDIITVSALFASEGETISISEVEIMEEVQSGEVSVSRYTFPYTSDPTSDLSNEVTSDSFEFNSDSEDVMDRTLGFDFGFYSTMTAVELKFPVGDTYKFSLEVYNSYRGDPALSITDFESSDTAEWQSFDLEMFLYSEQHLFRINVIMKGTGSGAPGFKLLDARFIGAAIENPTDSIKVASTFIESWNTYIDSYRYPDIVADGSGDQKEIMEAICTVKKASFDGVDCVGGDATATGTVSLVMGDWLMDGNIFMKSGVHLMGRFSQDDAPFVVRFKLEDGTAGNTDIGPIVVIDDIADAKISDIWIYGLYDSETSNAIPAVEGLGSTCLSVINSQNITCDDMEMHGCDGDGLVVRDSNIVNIDAGPFDDQYVPWSIEGSRGAGLMVDNSDSVWIRRYAIYDNGVAGIHISGSNNFTFEATIGTNYGFTTGEGRVGNLDGQQPIEIIVESSSLVTFQDMKLISANEPVMTISADSSAVSFNNLGLAGVESGLCVIEAGDPSIVAVEDDELTLVDTCFVKV